MTKRDRSWGDRPRRTGLPRALGRFFLELSVSWNSPSPRSRSSPAARKGPAGQERGRIAPR